MMMMNNEPDAKDDKHCHLVDVGGGDDDDDDDMNNEHDAKDDKHCHLVDGGGGDGHSHLLFLLVAPFIASFNFHAASILELVTIFSQN